jgi:hypothetical protein
MTTRLWAVCVPKNGPAKDVKIRGATREAVLQAAHDACGKLPDGYRLHAISTDRHVQIWTADRDWSRQASTYLPE